MFSALEEQLAFQIRAAGLPEPEREVRFGERKHRLDFGWPELKFGIEVEGGLWQGARNGGQGTGHSHPMHIERDIEKQALWLLAGWRVLRVSGKMVQDGRALQWIQELIGETR